MAENKLRVGIIGMGAYAAFEHVPSLRATGRAEVVAAARRNPERLALAQRELNLPATYTDWRAMLANEALDAVVVCTPHNQHVEPTVAALERGLHVLLEKPLAASLAEAQTILQAANRSDRVVMMGVNRRGDHTWRTAKKVLAEGQIGRLRQVSARVLADLRVFRENVPFSPGVQQGLDSATEMTRAFTLDIPDRGSWRNDPTQMGGDMLADTGAHMLDLMLWLAGAPAVEVLAYKPDDAPAGAAIYTLQARLANGVLLALTFNDHVVLGEDFDFRGSGGLAVYGDGGALTATSSSWGSGSAQELLLENRGGRQSVAFEGEPISPAAAFVAAIFDGAPNIATVADALNVVALTQAAYRSAAEHRLVRLDELA